MRKTTAAIGIMHGNSRVHRQTGKRWKDCLISIEKCGLSVELALRWFSVFSVELKYAVSPFTLATAINISACLGREKQTMSKSLISVKV